MKTFLLLLSLFFVADAIAQGDLSATLKGQNQSAKLTVGTIQLPNNQTTKTGSISALIESENDNLLSNPGFEHATYSTGWTLGGTGTHSVESAELMFGAKAARVDTTAQTLSIIQDSTLYASVLATATPQGYVRAWIYNTAANATICARSAGVTLSGNNCITLATSAGYKFYEIPVVLGGTSNGLEVSATSTTGITIVDRTYIGVAPASPQVAQAQLAFSGYFATTASAQSSDTTTSFATPATVAAIPGPTVLESNVCQLQTTDANRFEWTANNCPPGKYVVRANPYVGQTAAVTSCLRITDGTTNGRSFCINSNTTTAANSYVEAEFTYTGAGNRTFTIQVAAASGAINVAADQSLRELKFSATYYPPASAIYSQPNYTEGAWVSFTPTGTWTTNTTYTGKYRKVGDSIDIKYYITVSGAPSAGTLYVNLPTVAGSSILIDAAKINLQSVNNTFLSFGNIRDAGTTNFVPAYASWDSTSRMAVQYGSNAGSVTPTAPMTWASTDTLVLEVFGIPIVGWTQGPINGTFANVVTAPGISKPKTCFTQNAGATRTTACTGTPCTEYWDSCGTASPATRAVAGDYAVSWLAGTFAASTPVFCSCSAEGGSFTCGSTGTTLTGADGSLAVAMRTATFAGVLTDRYPVLQCTSQAP